ncbi:pyridoxal-dependent decarboxylase, pyridoxal binding domain-containing protein [Ditylenchus destructor]|uniref:ornithine decarboxylase n=1 Tax=Ditylenchus destructor TaxID=166010 RepID=A0AAD4MYW3_9BILA|nr:pyridoxal-dependent decarboxylase, pyridoxal binding domain-containing protein [Ditylenchus destructor]
MGACRFELIGDTKVAITECAVDTRALAQKMAQIKDTKESDDAFFVINLTTVVERMLEWRDKLPRVQPYYAVKCNDDPAFLKLLADLGAGFDCASKAEINQIVERGLADPSRILYANPCKTRSFIEHARKLRVKRMTFDSVEELHKIKNLHPEAELLLRIAVADPTAQCPLSIKFGCEPPLVEGPKLLRIARELNIAIVGVSFHVGSGCNDPTAFGLAISYARQLFDIGKSLGHNKMRVLDIGGGFPGCDTEKMSFDKIVSVINPCVDEYFSCETDVEIIAEPGRFFGSAPVSLVTNVIAATKVPASRITKHSKDDGSEGFMYYMNDGVYGSFNCILFDHFNPKGEPLFRSSKGDGTIYATTIWGPTCDGLDQVEAHTEMRQLSVGDWLYYPQMGAYTMVAASHFNGFDTPKRFYFMDNTSWQSIYGTHSDLIEVGDSLC